jgi:hypothetical protein
MPTTLSLPTANVLLIKINLLEVILIKFLYVQFDIYKRYLRHIKTIPAGNSVHKLEMPLIG